MTLDEAKLLFKKHLCNRQSLINELSVKEMDNYRHLKIDKYKEAEWRRECLDNELNLLKRNPNNVASFNLACQFVTYYSDAEELFNLMLELDIDDSIINDILYNFTSKKSTLSTKFYNIEFEEFESIFDMSLRLEDYGFFNKLINFVEFSILNYSNEIKKNTLINLKEIIEINNIELDSRAMDILKEV